MYVWMAKAIPIIYFSTAIGCFYEANPLIIDFSPVIATVEYAEAILVCDYIAWQGSEVSEIDLLPCDELYKEMIIRAIIFRLAVSVIFSKGDYIKFFYEYRAFKPIIDLVNKNDE